MPLAAEPRDPGTVLLARILARAGRAVLLALVLVVVLGTAFWALAFTSIYTRPVTRIAASRWIYNNLPSGTRITFEVWDDPVPLNIDGHNGGAEFPGVRMEPLLGGHPGKARAAVHAGSRRPSTSPSPATGCTARSRACRSAIP